MPRAEGWAGGRRVGPDEQVVMMGAAAKDYKKGVFGDKVAVKVLNEKATPNKLPKMTQEELAWLNSADIRKAADVEELIKERMVENGLNPDQEGVVRVLVGEEEIKMAIGSDFGTILRE